MNFRKHLKSSGSFIFNIIPFVDLFFLLVIFFAFSLVFVFPSVVSIKLPKAITSDLVNDNNITIFVTSENIFYYNKKVVTLSEIKLILLRIEQKQRNLLIKVDRRASVGRVVDLWDLGRGLGVGKINIAADQEE